MSDSIEDMYWAFQSVGLDPEAPSEAFARVRIWDDRLPWLSLDDRLGIHWMVTHMELLRKLSPLRREDRSQAWKTGGDRSEQALMSRCKGMGRFSKSIWSRGVSVLTTFHLSEELKSHGASLGDVRKFHQKMAAWVEEVLQETGDELAAALTMGVTALNQKHDSCPGRYRPGVLLDMLLVERGFFNVGEDLYTMRRAIRSSSVPRKEDRSRPLYDGKVAGFYLEEHLLGDMFGFVSCNRDGSPRHVLDFHESGELRLNQDKVFTGIEQKLGFLPIKPCQGSDVPEDAVGDFDIDLLLPVLHELQEHLDADREEACEGSRRAILLDNFVGLVGGEVTVASLADDWGFSLDSMRKEYGHLQAEIRERLR